MNIFLEESDLDNLEIIESMEASESEIEFKVKRYIEEEEEEEDYDVYDDDDNNDNDKPNELPVIQSNLKKNVINTNTKTKTKPKIQDSENSLFMNDNDLKDSVSKLLNLLLDEEMLTGFGWPEAPVEEVCLDNFLV